MPISDQNESLFEESRMSFGEHLEELRKVLIKSLYGIAIGCVIGFLVAEEVVKFLQGPLETALTNYYVAEGKKQLRGEHGYLSPELTYLLEQEQKIPETVLVDPGQLVAALRSVSPDFLSGVSLKPYRFSTRQIETEDVAALCRTWSTIGQSEMIAHRSKDQVARWKFLLSLLSQTDRDEVFRIGAVEHSSPQDVKALTEILNRLLERREIHDSAEFEAVISGADKGVLERLQDNGENPLQEMKGRLDDSFDPGLSERINRLLIAETFGDPIADPRLEVLPLTVWKSARYQSQSLGATETFMIWVKAGVVAGLVIASPWVFFQLWSFVAAGLYPTEQKYVYYFLPVSLVLFFSGVCLAFFFVFGPVLDFLFSFNSRMGISPQPRINDWLSFVMFLPLGFGIAFQLPLVMLFANRIQVISIEAYTSKWRVAVVAIFGIAMLVTPQDPMSMIMLAIPLTGLYFLGIMMCRWFNKPANPFEYEPVAD